MFKMFKVLLILILASNWILEIAQASKTADENKKEMADIEYSYYYKTLLGLSKMLQTELDKGNITQYNKIKLAVTKILMNEMTFLKNKIS